MNLSNVILAVEDRLSDAVATKILEKFDVEIVERIGFQGKSDLERKTPELNRAASGITIFMLTDLDSPRDCPPSLIRSWIRGTLNPKIFLSCRSYGGRILGDGRSDRICSLPIGPAASNPGAHGRQS